MKVQVGSNIEASADDLEDLNKQQQKAYDELQHPKKWAAIRKKAAQKKAALKAAKKKARGDQMLKAEKAAQKKAALKAAKKKAALKKAEQKAALTAQFKGAQKKATKKVAATQKVVAQTPTHEQAAIQAAHNLKMKARGDQMLKAEMAVHEERARENAMLKMKAAALKAANKAKKTVAATKKKLDKVEKAEKAEQPLNGKQIVAETHQTFAVEHKPDSQKGLGNMLRTVTSQNQKFQHKKHAKTLGTDYVIDALKHSNSWRTAQKEALTDASGTNQFDPRLKVGPEAMYKQLKHNLEQKALLKKAAIKKAEKEHENQLETARSEQAQVVKPTRPTSTDETSTTATAQNTEVESKVHTVAQEKVRSDQALDNMIRTATSQAEKNTRKRGKPKLGSKAVADALNHVTQQSVAADKVAQQQATKEAAAKKAQRAQRAFRRAAQLEDKKPTVVHVKPKTSKQTRELQRDMERREAAQLAALHAKWKKEDDDKKAKLKKEEEDRQAKSKFDAQQAAALKAAEVAAAHALQKPKQHATLTEAKAQEPVPHTFEEKQAVLQAQLKKLRADADEKQEAWLKVAAEKYHDKAHKLAKVVKTVYKEKRQYEALHHLGLH